MRVLHVVPTYLPAIRYGGPIAAVHGLCRALAARGHRVEVFATSIDGPRNSPVPHRLPVMIDGVAVRYFRSWALRRLSWAPGLARALRREIEGADIVHLHSVFLWPTWAAARVAAGAGVPYVLSPRGMLAPSLIARRNRLLKTAWIRLIEKRNIEKAAVIHATSELEAAALREFPFAIDPVAVVPNGVVEIRDAPQAVPRDLAVLRGDAPLALCLGRIARIKGLDRLLRAFALTSVGRLAIVGNDYEGLVPQLRQLARELNVIDRVVFVPRTVGEGEKELVFAAADAFVLASYSESFGNAAVEAMRRGLPVIVTQEVGASEIVRASGGGIVVDGEPPQLAKALSCLLEAPAAARSMGEAGRRHIERFYGWDSVAGRMEALYEGITAGAASRA